MIRCFYHKAETVSFLLRCSRRQPNHPVAGVHHTSFNGTQEFAMTCERPATDLSQPRNVRSPEQMAVSEWHGQRNKKEAKGVLKWDVLLCSNLTARRNGISGQHNFVKKVCLCFRTSHVLLWSLVVFLWQGFLTDWGFSYPNWGFSVLFPQL
jgi:hypothetical protein